MSSTWNSLEMEKSLRGEVIPFLLISGITIWNVGFIHTLWYFKIKTAIPFKGSKPPSTILWEALISFNCLLFIIRRNKRLVGHPGFFPTWELLIQSEGSGLGGERNRTQKCLLHKKIKRTNQHHLTSVPDRADVQ